VVRAVQDYLALMEAGDKPDRKEFVRRYPEIAPELAECLAGLEFVQAAVPELSQQPPDAGDIQATQPLGDFRLIREIGRGGMGIVYEAEQLSLGRRVALKVLPFAAAMDTRQLQRFKNEAQAAAHLHHQHIVPVHYVGCERGVHFYAMQYIEGQTLSAVIQDLREPRPSIPYSTPSVDTAPRGTLSTEHSTNPPAFFRAVANLGVQAAEALEYAHQLGVIHRDVKPANLLLEWRAGGVNPLTLWITDFGLAQVQSQAGLTMTGDLVGTPLDYRTDIYSLGATLYEL
jgi:serine/threonine protein kinase